MVLFPPPFYFVFYISNLLSYIQNNFSYELARPIMGTIFLVIIINASASHTITHLQLILASAEYDLLCYSPWGGPLEFSSQWPSTAIGNGCPKLDC